MYDGATVQYAGIKFRAAKPAKSARSVRRKILYRRPHARHKIVKSYSEILKFARTA